MNYPLFIINSVLDTVFPVRCVNCSALAKKEKLYLCKTCRNNIKVTGSFRCIGCQRSMPKGQTCYKCRPSNSIDNLISVTDYKDPSVIKLIKALKYRFIKEAGNDVFILIKRFIKSKKDIFGGNPLILAVPVHKRRLNWRGFNQSEILARKISENYLLDFESGVLVKDRSSEPQAEIEDKTQRFKNPSDTFKIVKPEKIKGRDIIIIDDIVTTGATLNECARVLKENGAKKVTGFVFAKG